MEHVDSTGLKLRIMLIPDSVAWILGTWASEIARWNSDRYDFIIFPYGEVSENKGLFQSVLKEVDVVHCLSPWCFPDVKRSVESAAPRRPVLISTIHHIVRLSQVEACLDADRIVVVCRQSMDRLVSEGVNKKKISLVYNGVNTDHFCPQPKDQARRRLGLPEGVYLVGFSGKRSSDHNGRKGFDIFTRVVRQLSSKLNGRLHVGLTGPGWEEIIESREWENVAAHYFRYLPSERMADFYSSLDTYLVTARVEGGPVPLLEAMSCGTPVVTTPVGTARDFVRDGLNGVVVPVGDVRKSTKAVLRLLGDESLREKISREGRRTIVENLQWRSTVGNMEQTYNISVPGVRDAHCRWTSEAISTLNSELVEKDRERWLKINKLGPSGTRGKSGLPMWHRIVRRVSQYTGRCREKVGV